MQPPLLGLRPRGVKLRNIGPFLLILGAMLAVSCGGVPSAPRTAQSPGTTAVGSHSSGAPKQSAAADARTILGEFAPPPGAVRLAKQPALPGGWGRYPVMSLNSTAQADAVGYWRGGGGAAAGAGGRDGAAGVGEGAHLAELFPAGRDHRAAELEYRVLPARRFRCAAHAG